MKIGNSADSAMIKALSRLNPRRGLPEVRLLCLIKSCQKRQTDELDDMDLATAFMDERHAMTLLRSISRTSREKRLWQEMLNHSDAAISAFIDQEDEADHIAAVDYLTERLKQDFLIPLSPEDLAEAGVTKFQSRRRKTRNNRET